MSCFFLERSVFNTLNACFPHIETSQLICIANQLAGFYMRAAVAINGLIEEERKRIKVKTHKFLSEFIYLKVFLEKKCQK